ncbi:MAG: FAD-binding protein [Nitrososphaerota archaeon]|nr:FAD-binding protein [Nitrososphaerota archaeon]
MPLNILVCIKQVPDTNDMRIDPKTNNLIREGVPAVVNPTDLNAIEEALRFRDSFGGSVRVLTMGPPQAEQSLKEAIAMGVDEGYLLSDRAFGGADTLATSYSLWKAVQKIEEISGKFDFLIFGKVAIDGETGQVGPGLAVRMGFPVVTYTSKTSNVDLQARNVEVERRVDDGVERVRVPIPCALTITEAANDPRQPTIDGLVRAKKAKINLLTKDTVNADPKRIGLGGSPTFVKKVVVPPPKKKGEIKISTDPRESAKWLVDRLVQIGAFGKKVTGGVISNEIQSQNLEQPTQQTTIGGNHGEVWVYVEQRYGLPSRVAWELMGEGKRLANIYGTKLCGIIIGGDVQSLASEAFEYGADRVYLVENPLLKEYRNETYGKAFAYLSNKYHPEVILMGGTHNGRDLAGVLATLIETGLIADCTSLDVDEKGGFSGTRPDFGGKELSTIVCPKNKPTMASVRTRVMKMPARLAGRSGELLKESIDLVEEEIREKILSFTPMEKAAAKLEGADVIVSFGRGLGNPKNIQVIEELANVLGGQVGATRAVVYLGWIPKENQIGQTGLTVRSRLYFAIGLSGAIQHAVGMENSDTIVAINKDPDAPIFGYAHFGIVGDLFQIVPCLMDEIKARGLARTN